MKINKLAVVALLAFSIFESTSAARYKKIQDEIVAVSTNDQPLKDRYPNNQKELQRLWDVSIFSGHILNHPQDFKDAINEIKVSYDKFVQMSQHQLKTEALKFYANRLRKLATAAENPTVKLKEALDMLSNEPGQRFDPVTYSFVLIKSPKEFEESRHFTIDEYKNLIEKIIKEHTPDISAAGSKS